MDANKIEAAKTEYSDIYDAFVLLQTRDESRLFLADLCTPKERAALQERWRVCQLLAEGSLSYREIHQKTGTSLATIGRVARFLREEPHQGYALILQRQRDLASRRVF